MAIGPPDHFYWDSCAFLAWLLPEPSRSNDCGEVLKSAELGECLIVTSSLTLVEVIKLKHQPPLQHEQEKTIRSFFENDYIEVRLLDRRLSEEARQLIWEHGIHPKDAVHVATAMRCGVAELHTYDKGLLALDGMLETGGGAKLKIRTPAARQRRIDSVTNTAADATPSQPPADDPSGELSRLQRNPAAKPEKASEPERALPSGPQDGRDELPPDPSGPHEPT